MPRFYVIGFVIVAALTIFTFVDIALTDSKRVRGVPKAFWFFVALIPLLGIILWFAVGKEPYREKTYLAPDDDPTFLKSVRRDERREPRRHAEQAVEQGEDGGEDGHPNERVGDPRFHALSLG